MLLLCSAQEEGLRAQECPLLWTQWGGLPGSCTWVLRRGSEERLVLTAGCSGLSLGQDGSHPWGAGRGTGEGLLQSVPRPEHQSQEGGGGISGPPMMTVTSVLCISLFPVESPAVPT